ncbi:MAG: nucleotide sugar dehydrogenase, partial [Planctomycetota bacterium]|nr:nucleotide sugar dehydrogenase [Planctomycetota bacterium]
LRDYPEFEGKRSISLSRKTLKEIAAAVIITDHSGIDYALVAETVPLIVDTRGVFRRLGISSQNIITA